MAGDVVLWSVIIATTLALAGAFFHPATHDYVVKYWWAGVGIVALLVGVVLLRRRPGRPASGGKELSNTSINVIDAIKEKAEESQLKADAALVAKTIEFEEDRRIFEATVDAMNSVEDSVARRRGLIKLVQSRKQ